MKTMQFIVSAACILGLFFSCSTEIDMVPDNAPKMLYVLGCVEGTATTHQVKIRKLVQGKGDATTMINDPAYYLPDKSMRVYLEDVNGLQLPLTRVLYPPQTGGLVSQDSNYVYELRGYQPIPGELLLLKIVDSVDGFYPTSSIKANATAGFNYPVKESVVTGRFNFQDERKPFAIKYQAGAVNLWTISIKYVDVMTGGESICRKATFSGAPDTNGKNSREFPLDYLWNIFNKVIPDDPNVDYRLFYRFDFSEWTGDSNLKNYIATASKFKDNRRLTASNIKDGLGLFFSVSHATLKNVTPYTRFWPALADSAPTRHLKFSRVVFDGPYTDPDSVEVNPYLSFTK